MIATVTLIRMLPWFVGLLTVGALVFVFRPTGMDEALPSVGLSGAIVWTLLTVLARILVVETTVRPIRVLGFGLSRADAFWAGWVRTFGNQIVPLAGLAFYLKEIVARTGIPLSVLASMATPQVLLAAGSAGFVGIASVACGSEAIGSAGPWLGLFYVSLLVVSLVAVFRAEMVAVLLPRRLAAAGARAAESFRRLARSRSLIAGLIALHAAAIALRGCRLWWLFALTGIEITWEQALLIVALAESATILQFTPGGLGLREGAVVGAAALVGVSQSGSVAVALIDRLLLVAITTVLVVPALTWLRRPYQLPWGSGR